MADFQTRSNVAQAARVTGERDLVTAPTLWKWAVQGKVFEAGMGPEDTASDSQAAIDDTLVTFALQAPASTSLLVIPILVRLMMTADGGALTTVQIAFTKPAGLCATSLALTGGRAMTSKHALYRKNPAVTASQASALYGAATTFAITSTALVAADYVMYSDDIYIDGALTVMTQRNVLEYPILNPFVAPHILTSGAAMLVYINTATTDSTWHPYIQWAEVTEDDLN